MASTDRILMVSNLYAPYVKGGAERSVQYLAEALRDLGKEVHILTLADRDETVTLNGVTIHRICQPNLYWFFRGGSKWLKIPWHLIDLYNPLAKFRVQQVLNEVRPDLVHTHNLAGFSTAIWGDFKAANIPVVHTIRDYYLQCVKSSKFKNGLNCKTPCISCRLASAFRSFASKNVDGVIGISHHVLDAHVKSGIFPAAMNQAVISNAYVVPANCTHNIKRDSRVQMMFLGEISAEKGVPQLLEAMHHVSKQTHSLGLAGHSNANTSNWFSPSVLDAHVNYLGPKKTEDVLADADVLVVPSLWEEPLGRVAIEAACWNVPVLASPRGGLGELVTNYQLGWLLPDSNSGLDWVDTINSLSMEKITMAKKTLNGVSQTFSPSTIALQHLEFYSQVRSRLG